MKLQKQVSDKRGKKTYHKYVVVLEKELIKKAGLEEGDELEGNAVKDKVRLKKK